MQMLHFIEASSDHFLYEYIYLEPKLEFPFSFVSFITLPDIAFKYI